MSLLDELRADTGRGGKACSVCEWLASRSEKEQAEWSEAIADKTISSTAIHRAMKARGFAYTDSVIGKHRRAHK